MIYKCKYCDTTYNISILSRSKQESIDDELLRKFCENDRNTAFTYMFNAELIRKNNIEIDYITSEYTITSNMRIEDMFNSKEEFTTVKIENTYGICVTLSCIIRKYMNISSKQYKQMIQTGIITVQNVMNVEKCKIRGGEQITIYMSGLKKYFREQQAYFEKPHESL